MTQLRTTIDPFLSFSDLRMVLDGIARQLHRESIEGDSRLTFNSRRLRLEVRRDD